MLEIIFVRHGESEMNRQGLYCGWTNSILTEKGVSQAEIVGEKLAHEEINLIITSDLDRCLMTAQIINKSHGAKLIKETSLKEINFGDWEGLSYDLICSDYPEQANQWKEDHVNFTMPNGESLSQMHKRVNVAFDKIINEYKDGKILIVSHSGVIRSILSEHICGSIDGCWKFKIENCGIARIQFLDNFPVLIGVNQ